MIEEKQEQSNIPPDESQEDSGGTPLTQITMNIMDKLRSILPYLDANLAIATIVLENEQMLPADYNLILSRNRDANLAVSAVDFDSATLTLQSIARFPDFEKKLTDIAAWCIIDLRDHITMDLKDEEQKTALNLMQELTELLQYAGYTKIHPMFKIPYKG